MNILVDQSGYALMNMGDRAMLQMALTRLKNLWPQSNIRVFTTAPEQLKEACSQVLPCSLLGRYVWSAPVSHRLHETLVGHRLTCSVVDLEWQWRNRFPHTAVTFIRSRSQANPGRVQHLEDFIEAVRWADLVVATGGGYITDSFKEHAIGVLNLLELAHHLGKPTVLVGQGLGPIQDSVLYNRAKTVLPKLDLITLREKRSGLPLCNTLGVQSQRCVVTGDDAIELAYDHRSESIGYGIGVNLRLAKYSNVNVSCLSQLSQVLQKAAHQYNAPLLPVPIAHAEDESDPDAIRQLLIGYDNESDGGRSLNTPLKVIQQAGRCRLTITGSYHAGVFSLSQGIPVIGLAKSEYYVDKFAGLAEQFGLGCQTVLLNDSQFTDKLTDAIDLAWQNAPIWRSVLLNAAETQIQLAQQAYQLIPQLVTQSFSANTSLIA
jgi:polysaccharide pyruvyl transferase WcaK-like protein